MDENPERSKPYKIYETNFLRLMELARTSHSPISEVADRINQEIELTKPFVQKLTEMTGPGKYDFDSPSFPQDSVQLSHAIGGLGSMLADMTKLLNTSHFLADWLLVMLVTFAEAYLQDALALLIAGGLEGGSLPPEAAGEITNKWIRNVLRGGSPHEWIRQLGRFGAGGYSPDLADKMKGVWERRHRITHSAEPVTHNTAMQEFISATKIVNAFVDTTDRFVVASYSHTE